MPTNLLLMKENKEALELSQKLGFTKTLFLDKDFVLVEGKNTKELFNKIKEAQRKNLLVVVKPHDEEVLRLVLEKTPAKMVFGQELLNFNDNIHFRRGGLDQTVCKIAQEKEKIIGFSFQEILKASDRAKMMGRMIFNLKLCRKYRVKVFFGNFSENIWEMRSAADLRNFLEVLGENERESLDI